MRESIRVRHPFFPKVRVTPARKAMGVCAALAGTFEELVAVAEVGVLAQRVVFPLLRSAGQWLSEPERDRLWTLFQVPVYAIRVDAGGRVEAFECEAQDGMHLAKGVPQNAAADVALCECGRPGGRLMPERPSTPKSDAAD